MNCQKTLNLRLVYIDNAVTPSVRAKIERHLKSCPQCQKRFEETACAYADSHMLIPEWSAPPPNWNALAAMLRQENIAGASTDHHSAPSRRWRPRLAAATCVALGLMAGIWLSSRAPVVVQEHTLAAEMGQTPEAQPEETLLSSTPAFNAETLYLSYAGLESQQ